MNSGRFTWFLFFILKAAVLSPVFLASSRGFAQTQTADMGPIGAVIAALLPYTNEELLKSPDKFFTKIATDDATGDLQNIVDQVGDQLQLAPAFQGKLTDEGLAQYKQLALHALRSQAAVMGKSSPVFSPAYMSWEAGQAVIDEELKKAPDRRSPYLSGIRAYYDRIKPLSDAVDSFRVREELIKKAQSSVDLVVWALYGDATGFRFAKLLIDSHKTLTDQGKRGVRVIVDGQTSQRPGYSEAVALLKKNSVPVVEWTAPKGQNPFFGQHQKYLIIDDRDVVAGGRNFGTAYSHESVTDPKGKWVDFDFLMSGGDIGYQLEKLFFAEWNRSVPKGRRAVFKLIPPSLRSGKTTLKSLTIFKHDPVHVPYDSIYFAHLDAIKNAKKEILIENAYVILTPSLKEALRSAIKDRKIPVTIHTNSMESVDEPIVSYPIFRSALELGQMGAKVCLKKGATLHSKNMVVDQKLVLTGSYNLHPRSYRLENEIAFELYSESFAKIRAKEIEKSCNEATPLESLGELDPLWISTMNPQHEWVKKFFFDIL